MKAIQRMLGHSSPAMTLGVYSGLFDAVAERLEEWSLAALGVEQPVDHEPGAAVAEVFEGHGLDGDMPGHAVPLECVREQLRLGDLAEPSLEAVASAIVALDEPPVAADLELPALDVERVAASEGDLSDDELRLEERDGMLQPGMEHGINASCEALDALLARLG